MSKISFKSLSIILLFYAILLVFLWYYKLDNDFLAPKKDVLIELFGQPDMPIGNNITVSQKPASATTVKQEQGQGQKKLTSDMNDENLPVESVDSIQDENSTDQNPDGIILSSQLNDSAWGANFGKDGNQNSELPSFAGGGIDKFREWMIYNIKLSNIASQKKIKGTLFISFVVDITGEVTEVTVQKGIDPVIDDEAVRIIKSSPPWKPGRQFGRPVRIVCKLPLTFSM